MANSKLWGGRFVEESHQSLRDLNNSLPVDKRLFDEDITGSVAYARALERAQLISQSELEKLVSGLEVLRCEWKDGRIEFAPTDEDVHTVNERRLMELIGAEVGGKLHTGRSRNDQIATDMRLWTKKALQAIQTEIRSLIAIVLEQSEKWSEVLMAGYTHLQRAQAIRFSHWLLSYGFYFSSDYERVAGILKSVDFLPLGSGAIAGTPFNIDRVELATELGFQGVTRNSMYAVGDRDFVVEFNFANALLSLHLSRLAEDLIIYSSKEFGFTQIADSFSTGSSLMPQKRNPDSLELMRGISGEIFGHMAGFMMTMKGLPSTYNKDMQSDKSSMFATFDRIMSSLYVAKGVLSTLIVNKDKCQQSLSFDMLATDIAYYLVRKGVSFRAAHHAAGEVIKYSEENSIPLKDLSTDQLEAIHPDIGEDLKDIWSFEASAEQYQAIGGTGKSSIQDQITYLKDKFDI